MAYSMNVCIYAQGLLQAQRTIAGLNTEPPRQAISAYLTPDRRFSSQAFC